MMQDADRQEPHFGAPPPGAAADAAGVPPADGGLRDDAIEGKAPVEDDVFEGKGPVEDDVFEGKGPVEDDVFEGKGPVEDDVFEGKGPVEDDVFDPEIEETIARSESADIPAVDRGGLEVLTTPNGLFGHFSENLRKSAVLFRQDGRLHLHVVKGHRRDLEVRALLEALGRAHDLLAENGLPPFDGAIVDRDAASIAAIYARAQVLYGEEDASAEELQEMEVKAIALFRYAAQEGATDFHIQVTLRRCQLRMRVDGDLQHLDKFTFTPDEGRRLLRALFAMADNAEPTYKPTDSQLARLGGDQRGDLPAGIDAVRIQYIPLSQGGRYAAIRIQYIPVLSGAKDEDVDALGYEPEQMEAIRRIRRRPNGAFLVCGPTGSGKSRTLQVVVEAIDREQGQTKAIFTVEDPVEYPIRGAAQRPVITSGAAEDRKQKFQQAVNDALRQDPDVVMISELRDRESARMFFTLAQTGHLTLSTLHANSALASLQRLRDEGVEAFKLKDPSLVIGLVAQRLVPILCPHCAVPLADAMQSDDTATRDVAVAIAARFESIGKRYERVRLRGPGCDFALKSQRCKKGFFGRRVVAEVVETDEILLELAARDKRRTAHRYWLEHKGGRTMLEIAIERSVGGEIDPRDVEKIIGPIELDAMRERMLAAPMKRDQYEQILEAVERGGDTAAEKAA